MSVTLQLLAQHVTWLICGLSMWHLCRNWQNLSLCTKRLCSVHVCLYVSFAYHDETASYHIETPSKKYSS